MEELLLLAGYHSDTDSIRSTVTASLDVIQVRKRSGRKQQAPRRAAFDSEYVASCAVTSGDKTVAGVSESDILVAESKQEKVAAKDQSLFAAPASAALGSLCPVAARTAASPVREKKGKHDIAGPCCHCNATTSPQWRKGPKGKPVLCNACGIRFLRNRTLTKVMPKKRRNGGGAAVLGDATAAAFPKAKRSNTETAAAREDCGAMLATEELLVTDDTLTNTDDAAEEAISTEAATAALSIDLPSNAAAAAAPANHDLPNTGIIPQFVTATGSSSSGYEVHDPSIKCCASGVQPLAAGSTHLLLGTKTRLHSSSPLSVALTMHQQQQLVASPNGFTTGSPVSNTSALSPGVRSCAGSLPSSPLLLTAARTSDTLLPGTAAGQQQQQDASMWVHLLATQQQQQINAGALASQLLPEPAPLLLSGSALPSPAVSAPSAVDILQLVQQISGVLGGVGPAVEFIRAMQSGGAAAAAALAAAAAAAASFR